MKNKDMENKIKTVVPTLRFPEFRGTEGWEMVLIGNIGETYGGLTGKNKTDFGNGKKYITYKQVYNYSFVDITHCDFVCINASEKQNHIKFGDILFTQSSETPEEVGISSVMLDKTNETIYLNSFCFGLRPFDLKRISPYFSKYLFRSQVFRSKIIPLAQGITRFNISPTKFKTIKIPIPTSIYNDQENTEQQKIADCLSSLDDLIEAGRKYNVPVLMTEWTTSRFDAELTRWLNVQLAPCITIHGVLVDVYGEGVLIMGESGIGKSEAALELIKRGHRLVTDDVVEIRKVSDETLIGASPEITKHFIELRGIGIIDVKALFGVESILDTANIDMVIKLEEWDRSREYDRLGIEDNYTEFLGNKVVCYSIPIRPGRNVAVIVESASVNHRQKKMGYNAAKELYKRVTDNLMKQNDEEE